MNKLAYYSKHTSNTVISAYISTENHLCITFNDKQSLKINNIDNLDLYRILPGTVLVGHHYVFNDTMVALCFESDEQYINIVIADHGCLSSVKNKYT